MAKKDSTPWTADALIQMASDPPPHPKRTAEGCDLKGFCAQRFPDGSIKLELQYESPSQLKRRFMEVAPKVKSDKITVTWLRKGRRAAEDARELVDNRNDPQDEADKEKQAKAKEQEERKAQSDYENNLGNLEQLVEVRLDSLAGRASHYDEKILFDRDVFPEIGRKVKVKNITGEMIARCVQRPIDRAGGKGGESSAGHVYTSLHAMFEQAIKFDLNPAMRAKWGKLRFEVDVNPVRKVTNPVINNTRDVWLTKDDIRRLWAEIETYTDRRIALCLKLLYLTGQRVNEVAGMQWRELDLDELIWTIPKGRRGRKTKLDHFVPITPMMVDVINEIKAEPWAVDDSYVFPQRKARGEFGPLEDKNILNHYKIIRAKADLEHTVTRDARGTVKTHLAALKIPQEIRDRVQCHVQGVHVGDKHYNRYDYMDEKRDALERWQGLLANIVTGEAMPSDNVVDLR